MSLGRLSPGDYTIWQIRGKEGFINSLEGIQWYKVSERLLLTNTQCVSLELLRWNPSGNWVIQISVDENLVPEYFKQYRTLLYIFQGL